MYKITVILVIYILVILNNVAEGRERCPAYYSSRLIEIPLRVSFESATNLGASYFRYTEPILLLKTKSILPYRTKTYKNTISSVFCIRKPDISFIEKKLTFTLGPRKLNFELPDNVIFPDGSKKNDDSKIEAPNLTLNTITFDSQSSPDWITPINVTSSSFSTNTTIQIKFACPKNQSIEGNPMAFRIEGAQSACRGVPYKVTEDRRQWIDMGLTIAVNDEKPKIYQAKYSPLEPCGPPEILKVNLGLYKVKPINPTTLVTVL